MGRERLFCHSFFLHWIGAPPKRLFIIFIIIPSRSNLMRTFESGRLLFFHEALRITFRYSFYFYFLYRIPTNSFPFLTINFKGAENLLSLLKNYARNRSLKTSITVGVIGFPNVGKSSVINSLKRARVCSVGSTPGLTKSLQTISLDKNIKLLDCPGIVFGQTKNIKDPKVAAEVALRNCVKIELLDDPMTPVELILSRCKSESLQQLYNIRAYSNVNDFLVQVANARGKLRRGGIPDVVNAARSVLLDWNNGKIPFYTTPPVRTEQVGASIVTEWAKEFELASVDDGGVLESTKTKDRFGKAVLMNGTVGMVNQIDMDLEIPEVEDDSDMESDGEDFEIPEAIAMDDDDEEDEMTAEVDFMDDDDEGDDAEDGDDNTLASGAQIHFGSIKGSKKQVAPSGATKKKQQQQILDDVEAELNPRVNQQRKKAMKKQRKEAQKWDKMRQQLAANEMDVEGDGGNESDGNGNGDDAYDFTQYFKPVAQMNESDDDEY